jgi:hypothetical protein
MTTTERPEIILYQKLGKVFYAIAAADKNVRKAEYDTLLKIVKKEWMNVDAFEDEFHSDAAFQIEIVFGWLDYNQLNAEACLADFKDFKKEHERLFTEPIKQLIWKTANAIAHAFAGKNKSETLMLTRLKLILEENHK